jgi:aldehyde dehydrogenase (NAD+)
VFGPCATESSTAPCSTTWSRGWLIRILKHNDAGGSADEAVELANNTEFGLGGRVFGKDPKAAPAVADQTETGSVGINYFAFNHAAPLGGRHDSGLDTEYGSEGLRAYLS